MGYDNLLFDQFIFGATLNNTKILKSEVVNVWFEHTQSQYERAMFKAYNNIDFVSFLNIIDLETINDFIVELWKVYKTKYTYSSKEDYIKSFWQFTIYEIEDFLKETYYVSGYNYKGFQLWFCNDKTDISNNLWYFLDEDKDPDYYKQYFKKVIELLKNFQCVNFLPNETTEQNNQTPFTDPKTHELFNYIVDNWNYNKGQKWADIWNVINDLENYKPPYKNEYQNYIIQRFGYTGKFQYDKVKRDGNRDKQNLLELIQMFSKK